MKAIVIAAVLALGLSGCAVSVNADWTPGAKKSFAEFKAAQKKSLAEEAAFQAACKAKPSFECAALEAQRKP
jgi:hypothetical protein